MKIFNRGETQGWGGGWGRGTSYVSYLINFWSICKISIILSTPSAPGAFLWDDRSSWYNFDWLQSPLQTHMYYAYIRKTVRNERLFFFNNESTMKRLFVSIAVVFKKQDGCVYCRHVASFLKTHRRTTMYLDKQEKGQNPNTWKISKTWGWWGCGGACSYCFNFTLTFLIFTSILYTRKK